MAAFMTVNRVIKLLEQHRGKLIAVTPGERIEVFSADGAFAGTLNIADEEFVATDYLEKTKRMSMVAKDPAIDG